MGCVDYARRGHLHLGCVGRLKHIRDGLHDPLKQSFGNERYTDMMGDAHFPSRGGLPGTTQRLRLWFQAFCTAVNSGAVSPPFVARTLRLLDAPLPADRELRTSEPAFQT